jgi:hypothetical protein
MEIGALVPPQGRLQIVELLKLEAAARRCITSANWQNEKCSFVARRQAAVASWPKHSAEPTEIIFHE